MRKTLGSVGLTLAALALVVVPGSAAIAAATHPVITQSNSTSATVGVPATKYQVRVTTTTAPCWVQVRDGSQLLFQGVVQPHRSRTFRTTDGKLSVQLGSVHARVTVLVHGKTVRHWAYIPTSSPYALSFTWVK